MKLFLTTGSGKRFVFGNNHRELPFACTPKQWHLDASVHLNAGLATVKWSEFRFGKTIDREHYIEAPLRRGFWLVGPPVGTKLK